jgi:CheY-like chemotaxis protein
MDMDMPYMNGLELLSQLRRDKSLRDIRVIPVTGSQDKVVLQTALKLGVSDFILKPINFEDLILRIKTNLLLLETEQVRNLLATARMADASHLGSTSQIQLRKKKLSAYPMHFGEFFVTLVVKEEKALLALSKSPASKLLESTRVMVKGNLGWHNIWPHKEVIDEINSEIKSDAQKYEESELVDEDFDINSSLSYEDAF